MSTDWFVDFFQGLALELWRKAAPPEMTSAEADFLQRALALKRGAPVLDVPCGNGRLALELARRGCHPTGVDLSSEFLAEARTAARRAGLRAQWHRGDMRRPPPARGAGGRYAAAFCFGNSFGYLDRAGTVAFLRALAAALRPGARLAIDTHMAAESMLPQLDHRVWVPVDDLLLLVEHEYDVGDSRLDTTYTFVQGARRETRQACHWIFTVGEIGEMLHRAGFAVLELSSDLHGRPFALGDDRLLIVAEKARTPRRPRRRGQPETP